MFVILQPANGIASVLKKHLPSIRVNTSDSGDVSFKFAFRIII
jgi:hypothetical protein